MVYQDRIETNLLQLFAQQEYSAWLSMISVIICEVNNLLVFCNFPFPSTFLLLLCPTVVSVCLKRSMSVEETLLPTKRIF